MTPYRILITGSREWTDRETIRRNISAVAMGRFRDRPVVIVHGAARGADIIADSVAREFGLTPEPHPAEAHGSWPQCGPLRNQHMVNLGADICLAFPTRESRGTWDCIKRANAAGIRVVVVPASKESR